MMHELRRSPTHCDTSLHWIENAHGTCVIVPSGAFSRVQTLRKRNPVRFLDMTKTVRSRLQK